MSTSRTIQSALASAKNAYDTWSEYSDRKADQAYATLTGAAQDFGPRADKAVDNARDRVNQAVERSSDALESARKDGKKLSRRNRKKLEKARKKARKEARKVAKRHDDSGLGTFPKLLIAAGTIAVGAAAFNYLQRRNTPVPFAADVDKTLKGDETFSDVEPNQVKFEHADESDVKEAKDASNSQDEEK